MPLPTVTRTGELPPGVHPASLPEVLKRFGSGTLRRRVVAMRLERVYELAIATGHMARFIVFGSFITAKPEPNDVDLFLLMEDSFAVDQLIGEARVLFDHATAQARFGASVFWLRRATAFPNEREAVAYWQIKRDGARRGIVEVILE